MEADTMPILNRSESATHGSIAPERETQVTLSRCDSADRLWLSLLMSRNSCDSAGRATLAKRGRQRAGFVVARLCDGAFQWLLRRCVCYCMRVLGKTKAQKSDRVRHVGAHVVIRYCASPGFPTYNEEAKLRTSRHDGRSWHVKAEGVGNREGIACCRVAVATSPSTGCQQINL